MSVMPFNTLLDEALEAWQYTRAGIMSEIENLADADLRYKPHPESRTAAEIAIHVAETGMMMTGELSRPDGNFQRKSFPDFIKEYARGVRPTAAGKRPLLQMLKRTHSEGERRLRQAGELHMLQLIARFDGERGTRLAWMNHGISHEEYHRGQLALYARLVGRVPALTKLIRGES
jgi:uncharacterized damage-inducible protein DinB